MKKTILMILIFFAALISGCQPAEGDDQSSEKPTAAPTATSRFQASPLPDLEVGSNLSTADGNRVTIKKLTAFGKKRWAVGERDNGPDLILYTPDRKTWADTSPPDSSLDSIQSVDAFTLFWDEFTAWAMYNGSNQLWKTINAGETWQSFTLGSSASLGGMIDAVNSSTVWVMLFSNVGGPRNMDITLYRTLDGGETWETMLDPSDFGSPVHGFGKTGINFGSAEYGWITRDTQGFYAEPFLDVTRDGGKTWDALSLPPPPAYPELFQDCNCTLFNPDVGAPGVGSFRLSCSCYNNPLYEYTDFDYQTLDEGEMWLITAVIE